MVTNKNINRIVSSLALVFWAFACGPVATAHEDEAPDMNIRDFVRSSEFVFKGTVLGIDYRTSEPVTITDPTTGEPNLADGSLLPHAFVKFSIDRIYKGNPPEGPTGGPPLTELTLRLIGGPAFDDPDAVLFVDTYPFFDIGDRSVLFVQGNEFKPCPLYRGGYGRLWLLPDPDVPGASDLLYNNYGNELVLVPGTSVPPLTSDEVAFGPFHNLEPINKHNVAGVELERVFAEPNDEYSLPGAEPPLPQVVLGPQLDELSFDAFLDQIVSEVHTREELAALPPINTANPDTPFYAEGFTDDEPNDYGPEPADEPERAWLDNIDPARRAAILQAEREEAELTELTGGDPVLPETACDIRVLTEGPIPGDIYGPEGRPDCRVDFFDFALLAFHWLECNDPDDPLCISEL